MTAEHKCSKPCIAGNVGKDPHLESMITERSQVPYTSKLKDQGRKFKQNLGRYQHLKWKEKESNFWKQEEAICVGTQGHEKFMLFF